MNYKRIYDSIVNRAKTRVPPEGYIERHHIIPRCLGGDDTDENLVALTPEEHYVAHQLLVKMYPNEGNLIYAANKMCVHGKKNKGRRNNKRYGWLKRKYSEQRKVDSIGSGNPQYGTMWINKIGTTENRKIKKGEPIPEGWKKGRCLGGNDSKCIICNKEIKRGSEYCKKHSQEKRNKESKLLATELFREFIYSDIESLRNFCDSKNIHQSGVTHLWNKYIDGYRSLSERRKTKYMNKVEYAKLLNY